MSVHITTYSVSSHILPMSQRQIHVDHHAWNSQESKLVNTSNNGISMTDHCEGSYSGILKVDITASNLSEVSYREK